MLKLTTGSFAPAPAASRRPLSSGRAPRRFRPAAAVGNGHGKMSILIADREAIFRLGLKKLLAVEEDLRVVAQAENTAEVLRLCARFRPDVLFVQAEIPGDHLESFLTEVRHDFPSSKIVLTASLLADEAALQAVKAGASGVILKSAGPELFVKCARRVMAGEVWLPKRQVAKLVEESQSQQARPVETLTRREKAVISCLILGWRNREIGRQLSISEQTVKNHLRSIYDKVGVSDRLELVLYAIHQRLELPPALPSPA